jgi:hypothetical protein
MGKTQVAAYPFRPKSTAALEPGQFWSVPLPDGRFACGRVLQINGSMIPSKSRTFFGGLLDWIDACPPTAESIAKKPVLECGIMHIRAITNLGGEVLGQRSLESDQIELPTLLSALGGAGAMILHGADTVREARRKEWGKLPQLEYWGWDCIQTIAIARLMPGPKVSQ